MKIKFTTSDNKKYEIINNDEYIKTLFPIIKSLIEVEEKIEYEISIPYTLENLELYLSFEDEIFQYETLPDNLKNILYEEILQKISKINYEKINITINELANISMFLLSNISEMLIKTQELIMFCINDMQINNPSVALFPSVASEATEGTEATGGCDDKLKILFDIIINCIRNNVEMQPYKCNTIETCPSNIKIILDKLKELKMVKNNELIISQIYDYHINENNEITTNYLINKFIEQENKEIKDIKIFTSRKIRDDYIYLYTNDIPYAFEYDDHGIPEKSLFNNDNIL